jgi:hypothetical protein
MAATTAKQSRVVKTPATDERRVHAGRRATVVDRTTELVDRTTELSDEVLKSLEAGQRTAIEALRKFVETGDGTLPRYGEGPSKRQKILDSAMEMADRLAHTQYDFIRKVIDSTAKSLSRRDAAKPNAAR